MSRAPETESLAAQFGFGHHGTGAHGAIRDGDLMMIVMKLGDHVGVVGGAHRWLFRRASSSM